MNQTIVDVIKDLYDMDVEVTLARPEPQFGDYSTNVAMQLAGRLQRNPREVAEEIVGALKTLGTFADAHVAGPGFINVLLSNDALVAEAEREPAKPLAGKVVVAEYSDPNPFKVLHAGHLYTTIVGDSIARLVEAAGASVHRVNFGGDVGLHVAKNMWATVKELGSIDAEKLDELEDDLHVRSAWLSARYVEGNDAYENDGQISKRPVRALTLSALAPRPGEHLWDIGSGSGSIAIEWLLAHPAMQATGFEADPARAARARSNALALGADRLTIVEGRAPEILAGQPLPDAVFIGGGLGAMLLETLWATLKPGTRLVANAVTLESEALLAQWHASKGGTLLRIELAEASPLGTRRGWKSHYPVVQWAVTL